MSYFIFNYLMANISFSSKKSFVVDRITVILSLTQYMGWYYIVFIVFQTSSANCPAKWVQHSNSCYLFETRYKLEWIKALVNQQKKPYILLHVDKTLELSAVLIFVTPSMCSANLLLFEFVEYQYYIVLRLFALIIDVPLVHSTDILFAVFDVVYIIYIAV